MDHLFPALILAILMVNSSSSFSTPEPLPWHSTPKPDKTTKTELKYFDPGTFANATLAKGCSTCTVTESFIGPLEANAVLFSACCSIEDPSYLELDELRAQIAGKRRRFSRLDHLLLNKVSVYEFLFDTDHENMAVDTIYNADFVVGYFRPGSYADGVIHNNNGRHVRTLHLEYCELSPEMLALTLTHMSSLRALHLDHVRLIPYPPGENTPSDILNIIVQRFGGESANDQPLSLSLVDLRLSSLRVRQFKSRFSEDKFLSMSSIPQLRMLSLARNGLKSIDNTDFFHRKDDPAVSALWYLDLSGNKLQSLGQSIEAWLPPSVTHLHLEGNQLLALPDAFAKHLISPAQSRLNILTELWIDVKEGGNHSVVLCNQWNSLEGIKKRLTVPLNSVVPPSTTTTTTKQAPMLPMSPTPKKTSKITTKNPNYV